MKKVCIVDCGTEWMSEIKNYVENSKFEYEVVNYKFANTSDFRGYSGVIITGAPIILTKLDIKDYLKNFKYVLNINIPILGICLGHQVIGLLHGANISKGVIIDKMERIEIVHYNSLFKDIKSNSQFREEHSEYIDLPNNFVLLARSASCGNEAMKHKNKNVFGVQFHPEVSGIAGELLLRNFFDICFK